MSKIPNSYIIDTLRQGGYIAKYENYFTDVSGVVLTGTSLQGVCLMDKDGKQLYDIRLKQLDDIKANHELIEINWQHEPTRSSGVEYYLGKDDELR